MYVNKRALGHAFMQDDRLEGALTLRGRRRTRLADCQDCPHERVVQAFAHRRSRDEHWPIAYCVDCFGIVAGLDPLVRARRPRWKFDERNAVAGYAMALVLALCSFALLTAMEWTKRRRSRLR